MVGSVRISTSLALVLSSVASGQIKDPGPEARDAISRETDGQLQISLEVRSRLEDRQGVTFGKDPDRSADFVRTRFGVTWKPAEWIKFSGMFQDSRAPFYGNDAGNTVRDPIDLHEAYMDIRSEAKTGFGLGVGRRMLNYGDQRLLGIPQWSNVARTFDEGRVWWRADRMQIEFLLLSVVKIKTDGFNDPNFGDKVYGMYDVFPDFAGGHKPEVYILRHDQNNAGGYTGTGTLGMTAFGSRWTGPIAADWRYAIEGVGETGHRGIADQNAAGWSSVALRHFVLAGKSFDFSVEYKYAGPAFDQMYAANHDKFGHQDLFGWRNIHNARGLATWTVRPSIALSMMYDNYWLADPTQPVYNGSGKAIVSKPDGSAGRHVGQDIDWFGTWKLSKTILIGAGIGTFVQGEFIKNTTPGASPFYIYVFQSYSF